jgi:integrase
MAATIHRLNRPDERTVTASIDAYLDNADLAPGSKRNYTYTLRALAKLLGQTTPVHTLDDPDVPDRLSSWINDMWGDKQSATFNRNIDAIRSAFNYWKKQGWIATNPAVRLERRKRAPDRTRAVGRSELERALNRESLDLRERLLWRMLYETAARASEILNLNVEDLDLSNRRTRVTRKGGANDIVVWNTKTARLLPRYLNGRSDGPLFLTERKAKVELSAYDRHAAGHARLSYRRAAEMFTNTTGWTLHQLRHSALTHAAEDGTNTATLMAYSGHESITSLARYTRVSPEALQKWQKSRDEHRRGS